MSTLSKLLTQVVTKAAPFMPDKAPDPLRHARTYMGKPLDRVDGRQKVTGQARFSAEFKLDNLAYAAVVHSTVARGTIRRIDVTAARQAEGVLAVLTHENAPQMEHPSIPPPFSSGEPLKGTAGSDLPVLGDASIHWNGQPVAAES